MRLAAPLWPKTKQIDAALTKLNLQSCGFPLDFFRVQQDVRRRRCDLWESRRVDSKRNARRRAGMGSKRKADLHSEWWRRQRHGGAPGFSRQVLGRCHRADGPRREDDNGRSEDPQRVPVSAGTGSRTAARCGCATAGAGAGKGPRSAGPHHRGLVRRRETLTYSRARSPGDSTVNPRPARRVPSSRDEARTALRVRRDPAAPPSLHRCLCRPLAPRRGPRTRV